MMIGLLCFTTKWNKWNINPQRYGISTNQSQLSKWSLCDPDLRSGQPVDSSMEKWIGLRGNLQETHGF
jgi:hypothetical protein